MPMLRSLIACALLFAAADGAVAQDQVVEDEVRWQTAGMSRGYVGIIVGTVVAMEPGPFTEKDPPHGMIRVDEVLRGDGVGVGIPYATSFRGIAAPEYETQVQFEDGKFAAGVLTLEWLRRPVVGPIAGDRLIIVGNTSPPTGLLAAETYRLTPENRARVIAYMAPPPRNQIFQALAFVLILIAPFACGIMLRRSASPKLGPPARNRARMAAAAVAAAAFAVYAFYESGVPWYAKIRIDLFLLWLVLALTAAMTVIALVRA